MPALEGMRVLDMTQWEAGTSCTQCLAWLGADVVKVESPAGDPGRHFGFGEGDSAYFINWNANKRSVAIDLEKPGGRELLLRLVARFDVFVENYAPGVIEKLDLGYDVMRGVNPGIIYTRIKGFGSDGPYADYKSMDMIAQAAAGVLSVTGERDGPPMRPGATIGDAGSGVQAALAVTAAYVQKLRTGRGQEIELSMQEAVTYFMRTAIANGSQWGSAAVPRTGTGFGATVNLYPCHPGGPNDYIYLMVMNSPMWRKLCDAIGRSDLIDDPRFAGGGDRLRNHEALYAEISEWTRRHPKDVAMKTIAAAGVPCSAVLDTADLFRDPHLVARGFIQRVEHPDHGVVPLLGWPLRLSDSAVELQRAPLLGEHTDSVLREELELDEASIRRLHEEGVLAGARPASASR